MKNKIISLFILIFIFWWLWFLYFYYFVLNNASITIFSNTLPYEVNLTNTKLDVTFKTICEKNPCELIDIAPLEYEIDIIKEHYKSYKEVIRIKPKQKLELKIDLEKQFYIEKIDKTNTIQKNEKQQEEIDIEKSKLIQEKINAIKNKKINNIIQTYKIDEKWDFFIKKSISDDKLDLYYKDEKIYTFLSSDLETFKIQNIYNEKDYIYLQIKNENFIYNLWNWQLKSFFFPQDIKYIKKQWQKLFIVNQKWTFIYDIITQKAEYFYLFKDFVVIDDNMYLWVIYADEEAKKSNYNIKAKNDIVVKYNSITKDIKILQESSIKIDKIIFKDSKYYFYDDDKNIYEINNFN